MEKYDLIVVGAGPGGYVAAQKASALGKRVLLVEKENLGGVCTNSGCIPTKSLLNSAKQYRHAKEAEKFGVHCQEVSFNVQEAMAWKNETIQTLRNGIGFLMKTSKVDVLFGQASFEDSHHVRVNDAVYETDYLILATGSSPFVPPIEGAKGPDDTLSPNVLTSDQILELKEIPQSLAIIGGGVIGLEFASFFSMLGTTVQVIEMLPEILPMMDPDISKLLRRELKDVKFHLGCKVTKILPDGVVFLNSKEQEEKVSCDLVLMSVGRRANLTGLEPLKLDIERGAVVVDETLKTNVPNIYAIGDINAKSQLAHSASRMAEVAIDNIFGTHTQVMNYNAIPWAVYSSPEASGCGLTEGSAQASGRQVKVATVQMRSNGRFLAENGKRASGLVKVVVDAQSGALLGVHLLGPYSSELIWGAGPLIEEGVKVQDIANAVFPHPSISEVIKEACSQIHSN